MSPPRIELDGPYHCRQAVRRAAYRWASVCLVVLIAAFCMVALPAIAAVIHFGA